MHISLLITYFIIYFRLIASSNNTNTKRSNENQTLNNILFNSIKDDHYNLTSIYTYNYTTIKIQRHISISKNPLICVLGVLVNENGIKIEKEMLAWLLKEYEVYKIYQKFPGILYEYPALRFAQWLTENKNISFLLYLHTKGATHHSEKYGDVYIRKFWEKEFTKPNNFIYISEILQNKTDIAVPLNDGIMTWYNGMYISKRAFQLNNIFLYNNRYIYEYYFSKNNTRIKGIVAEKCKKPWNYLDLFNNNKTIITRKENKATTHLLKYLQSKIFKLNILYLIFYLFLTLFLKFCMTIYGKLYI